MPKTDHTPTVSKEARYFIRKGGAYYRPNAEGYTRDTAEAGRFTLDEAIAHSHPNGPDGPRDGIDYIEAHLRTPATDTKAMRQRVVEECAAFVRAWNGDTRDGDTFLISDEMIDAVAKGGA